MQPDANARGARQGQEVSRVLGRYLPDQDLIFDSTTQLLYANIGTAPPSASACGCVTHSAGSPDSPKPSAMPMTGDPSSPTSPSCVSVTDAQAHYPPVVPPYFNASSTHYDGAAGSQRVPPRRPPLRRRILPPFSHFQEHSCAVGCRYIDRSRHTGARAFVNSFNFIILRPPRLL